MKVRNALISVYDKSGLEYLGPELARLSIGIFSTGKTRSFLEEIGQSTAEVGGHSKLPEFVTQGVSANPTPASSKKKNGNGNGHAHGTLALSDAIRGIEEYTGHVERLNGRIKTLEASVFEAILTTDRNKSVSIKFGQNKERSQPVIDLVVVNFYPFKEVVSDTSVSESDAIENIDIGGPAMVRSAAKNYEHVIVVVDPADYSTVVERLGADQNTREWRRMMASKAWNVVAEYDEQIAKYFSVRDGSTTTRLS